MEESRNLYSCVGGATDEHMRYNVFMGRKEDNYEVPDGIPLIILLTCTQQHLRRSISERCLVILVFTIHD